MNESQLCSLYDNASRYLNQRMFGYINRLSYPFNKFQICNAYLIERSVSERKPLFISAIHKDLMQSLIVPTCLVLLDKILKVEPSQGVLTHFEDYMIYMDGRLKLIQFDSKTGTFVLCYSDKRGKHLTPIHDIEKLVAENIVISKKYFKPNAFSEDHYMSYIDLYQHSYCCSHYPPFEHRNKAIIVCPKKSVIEEMSFYKVDKHIPYAFISSADSVEEGESLRIDPALYFSSDYNSAVRFIQDNCNSINFPYIVVMQDVKVKNNLVNIRQDLAQKRYDDFVAMSFEEFNRPEGSLHWRWSPNDVNCLTGKSFVQIFSVSCSDNREFDEACEKVYSQLNRLSEEYYGTSSFKPMFITYLRWLRHKKRALQDLNQELTMALNDTREKLLLEEYEEIDVDIDLKELSDAFMGLSSLVYSIHDYLGIVGEKEYMDLTLVVPNCDIEEWQETAGSKRLDNVKIISDSLFPKVLSKITEPQEFNFSFIPPYKALEQLVSLPLQSPAYIVFNVTKAEIDLLNGYLYRIRKQSIETWEYVSDWCPIADHFTPKSKLSHGDYQQSISQLIDNSFIEIDDYSMRFNGDNVPAQLVLRTIDEKGVEQYLQLAGTTNVIRISGEVKQSCLVADLDIGDAFLLYSNPSTEHLYEILTTESEEFQRIETMSNLWKVKLKEYVETQRVDYRSYDVNRIVNLIELAHVLGIKYDYIEKSWLGDGNVVKFPQRRYLQKLVDLLVEDDTLARDEAKEIIAASRAFSSIMIKLGHNLSAEIHRVIISTNEENLADYISHEVFNREDNYLCLSQFDEKAIIALIKRNTPQFRVVAIEDEVRYEKH